MLAGYSFFQDEDFLFFDTVNVVNNYYRVELSNAKFDEVHVYDNSNLTYDYSKKDWDYATLLKARFVNNLEAGSIDVGGIPIEYVLFRKRKIDELVWNDVAMLQFDPLEKIYEYIDRMVQATEIYEYECVPLTATIKGKSITATVECDFDGLWITDKDEQYQLLYNLELGDIENVTQTEVIQTLSQYPVVMTSPVDYIQGSIKSTVVSEDTSQTGKINKRQERLIREKLMKFLKNKKPKILRDSAGRYYLISIIGNPKEIPNNTLQGSIADVDFQFVEIGNPWDSKTIDFTTFKFTPPNLQDGGNFNYSTPNAETNDSTVDGGDF